MVKFLGLYDPWGSFLDFFTVCTWGKARVTEIPGGAPPPQDPHGGNAWVTEIPGGASPPQTTPTTTFQKKDLGVDGRRRNVRPKNFGRRRNVGRY